MTRSAPSATGERLALAGVVVLAFAVRSVGFAQVFPGDGVVAYAFGDPHYHLRLAAYALAHFPHFLTFDPYVAFPDGAPVTYPPLYDLWVAASALLAGGSTRALEWAAAWWPPVLGALTTLPTWAVGRAVGGPRIGLGAAAVLAVLPASITVSAVGYADHHAAVVLLATCLLALDVALLDAPESGAPARAAARVVLLVLARSALLLTWAGAFLYLGIAEGSFALFAAALARRRALRLAALSLAATAALVSPVVARGVAGGLPAFSAVQLSWLSVAACAGLALFEGLIGLRRPAPTLARRLAEAAAIGGGLALAALVLPGLGGAILNGLGYLAKEDPAAIATVEQQPLLATAVGRELARSLFGWFAYAIPVAPLALAALAWRERRAALGLVATWNAALAALAMSQVRYANDLAPTAAVAIVLVAAHLGRAAVGRFAGPARSTRMAGAGALALAAVVLAPVVTLHHVPEIRDALRPRSEWLRSPEASMVRFARTVRETTPETSGWLDPSAHPEYGLLCDPSLGDALHYVARRPTLADNLGPWAGLESFVRAVQLLLGPPSEAGYETLQSLRARYVVTDWQSRYHPGGLLERLHEGDGRAREGRPALEHYRLVAEGPPDGRPLAVLMGDRPPPGAVPYKLFEVVAGAELDVAAPPGAFVAARVRVASPLGRRFVYSANALAGEDGRARLRVPYATGTDDPVHTLGAWRVEVDGRVREVEVGLDDVREGRTLRVD